MSDKYLTIYRVQAECKSGVSVQRAGTVGTVTDAEAGAGEISARLRRAPAVPADVGRFTSTPLFGQPGIYPDGPPTAPATGHRHSDASIEQVLLELVGTVGEPVFEAWTAGRTAVNLLTYGAPESPGRVVGPTVGNRGHERVVNERYRAEDARLLLPSIVHDLLWSGPGAGHAEETLLHALGAYVHAQLLARDRSLADLGTELARRENSITITLLNSRQPGSSVVTLIAPEGPGTIPGGASGMQTPDFWSVPFAPLADDGAPISPLVREVLAAIAGVDVARVPIRFDDDLGAWCSLVFVAVLEPGVQLAAGRALGLVE